MVAWVAGVRGLRRCIGALAHLLVMRQLRRASPLARIVATLGMLIVAAVGAPCCATAPGSPP